MGSKRTRFSSSSSEESIHTQECTHGVRRCHDTRPGIVAPRPLVSCGAPLGRHFRQLRARTHGSVCYSVYPRKTQADSNASQMHPFPPQFSKNACATKRVCNYILPRELQTPLSRLRYPTPHIHDNILESPQEHGTPRPVCFKRKQYEHPK